MEIIKEFNGFSGCRIFLMQSGRDIFVRKIGEIDRNHKRMEFLKNVTNIPKILYKTDNVLDMEYIPNLDMKTYLTKKKISKIGDFIIDFIEKSRKEEICYDYTDIYEMKLKDIDFSMNELPFMKEELLEKLPKILPKSKIYHGDMTLENIIYNTKKDKFYFIDCSEIEYDSWIFDISKLRQDLKCKWFLRNSDNNSLDIKIHNLETLILDNYPIADNKFLLIMMLLRVYKYTEIGSFERNFIIKGIREIWK